MNVGETREKRKERKKTQLHTHNTKNQALQEISQVPLEVDFS